MTTLTRKAVAPKQVGRRTPTNFRQLGSTKMYSMHEALARDRMRENEQRSRQSRVARELAAERRWHRVSTHSRAAQERHLRRLARAAVR